MDVQERIKIQMDEVRHMELRKLDKGEYARTRALWENVFDEDSKAFLDYYYFFKTRDNEIYVIEEDGDIRSMLHLNPYQIQAETEWFEGNYIIAVATEEAYRKRGYMGEMLRKSMRDMYNRKELFTFLMPAEEKIYTPYDFRFVYAQNVWMYTILDDKSPKECLRAGTAFGRITGLYAEEARTKREEVWVSEAGIGDGAALAGFFNTYFADGFQVYAVRNESYYQTMLFEQQSENGGIRLLKKEEGIVGTFLYGDEDGLEIREPLYLKEYETDFWDAVHSLCKERGKTQAAVYAGIDKSNEGGRPAVLQSAGEEKNADCVESLPAGVTERLKKPVIMVRIIHLESLLKILKVKEGEEIDCSFAVLDSILPQNSRVWKLQSKSVKPYTEPDDEEFELEDTENEAAVGQEEQTNAVTSGDLLIKETEDSEGVLTIAALTSLLFGYKSVEEAAEEQGVYLTERLMEELRKIKALKSVYLNEIV